jgi:hypothetical protein
MIAQPQLKVTSHVGRDLLASAASFKNEAVVVWEYVVNSLQYVDPGVSPRVQVTIAPGRKGIVISDNGRGMSADDLDHFFRMHAENLDRLAGRFGRGKFGTGKSAAFGIANTLRVDTVRGGKRNVAELTRKMIEGSGGEDIPVNWEVGDKPVEEPNGTTVSILDINLDRVKQASVIEYVERHLQAFRASAPAVAIDNHVCNYREPETAESLKFEPSPSQRHVLGDITLVIKVGRAPLPQVEQGITVTAGSGNLVAIERAGIDTKEFGNYLFGDIDVPSLEKHPSPIQPYDPSRSLALNPRHPVVAVLLGFIGSKLEEVRAALVRKSKEQWKRTRSLKSLTRTFARSASGFTRSGPRPHVRERHKLSSAPKPPIKEQMIGSEAFKRRESLLSQRPTSRTMKCQTQRRSRSPCCPRYRSMAGLILRATTRSIP